MEMKIYNVVEHHGGRIYALFNSSKSAVARDTVLSDIEISRMTRVLDKLRFYSARLRSGLVLELTGRRFSFAGQSFAIRFSVWLVSMP